ncbi:uncharacterized protein LOC141616763 isoform X1 [Silene latifolia]|uniref:uncharacterized protein LOC141616763 isoform X1 n=1 Tax=Silene latifolia TaxID=37657 RepID=UPI003D785C50
MTILSLMNCFSLPKPRNQKILLNHNHCIHHIKPSYLHKIQQISTTHLSNKLRNCTKICSLQNSTQKPPNKDEEKEQQVMKDKEFEFEKLFSNLNQASLKHEPGSLSSSIFLVAGTTVGAGILAIPAVTQESGFLASTMACIGCWAYMVVTGLYIAEVNLNTMCELGSGGVSLVSMAKRTLGSVGVQITCWTYIFIHYALLVAYIARSSEIITNYLGIPLWESGTIFSLVFGALCYFGSQRFIGAVNGLLVLGIITSFTALVVVASGDLHFEALLKANFEALPSSIPIIALAFVYQNVVPVLCTNLEGDLSKVRTAVILGTTIPLLLFLVWNGVILGTITNLDSDVGKIIDPLQQLRSSNGVVGPIVEIFSLLAIGTSYIGFVLGLVDFLADFLVLFGLLPAMMSWSDRYLTSPELPKVPQLVPGGKFTLSLVIGGAGWVIFSEILRNFNHT